MKSRIVYEDVTYIKTQTRIQGYEFDWDFFVFDASGNEVTSHTIAQLKFARKGSSDIVLQKNGTLSGNMASFTISANDFDESGDYHYQLVIKETDKKKAIALGVLQLLSKIE